MTQSYDLVLRGATVVNHDGEGLRDIAIAGGRIAALGGRPGTEHQQHQEPEHHEPEESHVNGWDESFVADNAG